MQNILINLFGRNSIQLSKNIICLVCFRRNKTVISHLPVNIFLVCFYSSMIILDQSVRYCIRINPSICRYLSSIAGSAHQGNIFMFKNAMYRGEYTRIITAAKINTNRIIQRTVYGAHILFQPFNIFHRHDRYLFQHICSCRNSIIKCNNTDAFLHYLCIVAHSYTPNAGDLGIKLFQLFYMCFKLVIVR